MKLHSKTKVTAIAALIGLGTLLFYACNQIGDGAGLDANGNIIPPASPYALPARYFKDSVEPIFTNNSCIYCHELEGTGWFGTGADSGGLNLHTADYASLVNQPAYEHQFNPDTIPRLRVMPGFPDSSYLYRKISMDTPGYGGRMPEGGQLPDSEIAIIRKWIEYGAPLGDTTTLTP